MTTALEKIEATISEISGPAQADYHKLVHGLVLRPNDMPDVKRVRKILDACGKSLDDLKADVLKLTNCHELEQRIAEAQKRISECPDLERRADVAEKEWEAIKAELVNKLDAKAKEVTSLREKSHRLRIELQTCQGQYSQAFRFATPRSVRDTPRESADWRAIDLFASDEPPHIPGSGRHVGVPQYNEAFGRPIDNIEIAKAKPRKESNGREAGHAHH
jgi:hypothetical protein